MGADPLMVGAFSQFVADSRWLRSKISNGAIYEIFRRP
jgi:hypothetical protein